MENNPNHRPIVRQHRTTMRQNAQKPVTAGELTEFSTSFNVNNVNNVQQREQETWQKILSDESNSMVLQKVEHLKTIHLQSSVPSPPQLASNRRLYTESDVTNFLGQSNSLVQPQSTIVRPASNDNNMNAMKRRSLHLSSEYKFIHLLFSLLLLATC